MTSDAGAPVDEARRRWMIATSVAGGIAGVAAVIPFVESFRPFACSARERYSLLQ
jgi:ubiquinol-cytochrome c reductase iron-sulfur subunit